MTIVFAIIGIGALWSLWGYFSARVEQTQYTLVQKTDTYEVRLYTEHLVAQTTVTGSYDEALNKGFRIVAGYIFGGNTTKKQIAMTAPVVENTTSTSIAMTAPVLTSLEEEGEHTIAFSMPRSYTLETLPTPTDSRVQIVTIPEKKMAALRFSLFRTSNRVQSKKQALLAALQKDGITVTGTPTYAGYNAPWTPPWMTRHEVMVEIL